MADNQAEINELKADIKAIKDNNLKWACDAGVLTAMTAINNRITGLEAPDTLPNNIHIAF
jgi:hypothetical protein